MSFHGYQTDQFFDELFERDGKPRAGAQALIDRIEQLAEGELARRQNAAEAALMNLGVTFAVYGDEEGTEKIWPFDLVPRIVEPHDWEHIETGLRQRIEALNLFLCDIYGEQRIINDGVVPRGLIESATAYRPQCMGVRPPNDAWCHITGTDLVRGGDGTIYVLEDNLRCPSGVSYVLENRQLLKRTFPRLFADLAIRPVDDYPIRLRDMLQQLAPTGMYDPVITVLTPGIYNSAYFEHSYLAQQMGVELVEGRDLVVHDGCVMMRTTRGLTRVDVIYRRIDDDFLDPLAFREDSMLGVPGLFDVWKQGRVAIANAPGTGVADDKVVYAYVPDIIRYYFDTEPILANVPTYLCWRESDRKYVLDHLPELVVKSADESGGYGMLIGPQATAAACEEFARRIAANPRKYIAQPVIDLSRVPTITENGFEGRHVDLRPYILYGDDIHVLPGGLTRVALVKDSLVVNSSQGGGSKDTWVLADPKSAAPRNGLSHGVKHA